VPNEPARRSGRVALVPLRRCITNDTLLVPAGRAMNRPAIGSPVTVSTAKFGAGDQATWLIVPCAVIVTSRWLGPTRLAATRTGGGIAVAVAVGAAGLVGVAVGVGVPGPADVMVAVAVAVG